MKPARYDITVYQSATFERVFQWKDDEGNIVDLTGYNAYMQVRRTPSQNPILDLSTENGKIDLEEVQGKIKIYLSAEETDNLPRGEYQYDLLAQVGENGQRTRLLEGKFIVSPAVTRHE